MNEWGRERSTEGWKEEEFQRIKDDVAEGLHAL